MKITGQIAEYLQRLHPDQRRAVKMAMRDLAAGKAADVEALISNLEGFYRLRVGKFRVIFRYDSDREVCCEFIEVREIVYEQFASMRKIIEDR